MKIHDLVESASGLGAFEVDNHFLTRRRACRIAASVSGAAVVKTSRLFRDSDDFCHFKIGDATYVIEEPFGDNSRYWIGPKESGRRDDLAVIRAAFAAHQMWKAPLLAACLCGALVLALAAYPRMAAFVRQDSCLDAGGRWERSTGTCTHAGP
jgi:hypothetical protein